MVGFVGERGWLSTFGVRTLISSKSSLFKLTENSNVCTYACRVGLMRVVWEGRGVISI